ncbi:MAG: peptidoglycan editing factor PgeF [Bacillota bacterium]|nr:peptidoglycan editing factor PgeF [Bacillota bacterium]
MISKEYKNLKILQFNNLNTLHGITTRYGGISKKGFESLNLGFYSEDSKENIDNNYKIFFDALNIDRNKTVATHQTHSDNIVKIESVNQFKIYEDTDGFITDVPGITLMTFYADCTPLYFYDPVKKVIGIAHSGWKGTEQKIGARMIDFFVEEFESQVENILVGIGPNISPKAYEVDKDFLENFEDKEFFKNHIHHMNEKIFFDMVKSNRDILLNKGILKDNIELSGHCTYNESQLFFSYRRQGMESGRMSGFIRLD